MSIGKTHPEGEPAKDRKPTAELMSCFLHKENNGSMNYITGKNHGFYCYSCSNGKIIDIFNLIDLMNQWQGKGCLRFAEQMSIAAEMFVNGEIKVDNPEDKHSNFIKFTDEMRKTMHNPHNKFIDIKNDNAGLKYLASRGIDSYTAHRLGVKTQYPTYESGISCGRAYIVCINSNGSYSRRAF